MRFWIAWQFLTIIPSPPRYRLYSAEDLGRSISLFPVVGLLLGLVLFGLNYLLGLFLPPIVVSILLVIALVILTGALHLDGFIDTCDGLVVRSSASNKLKIMSDTQVGAFGVVGGCCLILAKFAALFSLPEGLRAIALILMPILSRWGMVYALYAFHPAKKEGLGWAAKQKANWKGMAAATIFTLVMAFALLNWWGAALLAALSLILWAASKYLCSKFGGLTGDNYGAINEFAEVVVLILIFVIAELGGASWWWSPL
ncbi:MAG: adenosylcobinamide-GDP ribazoletransferase [Dehalococcoidia bacterium]|nr:adenosylcobinamide-GDP ribazoletransferase [Dehalococcoidia bacterium]